MLKLGDIVILNQSFGCEPINSHGLVFHDYGDGVQIIFQNGDFCGFSTEEQPLWVTKLCGSTICYSFINVMQLNQDYNNGMFNFLKRVSDSKLDNIKLCNIISKE